MKILNKFSLSRLISFLFTVIRLVIRDSNATLKEKAKKKKCKDKIRVTT